MVNSVSRRWLLKLSAASLAVPAMKGLATTQSDVPYRRKRRNVADLTAAELNAYERAIETLKQRSKADPADPTGYDYQAGLHNVPRPHPDGTFGACEHGSEEFFGWHRAHLVGFENLLRGTHEKATNVTIPYWDWTVPASGSRFPKVFERLESPLYHSARWTDAHGVPKPLWDANEVRDIVAEGDWNLFGGDAKSVGGSFGFLESGPHNTMHPWIGSTMGDPSTAAEDPIYWSFHAFIDLIWSRWQKLHHQSYQCGNCRIWLEPFSYRVDEMTNTTDFGYEYEYDYSIDTPSDEVDDLSLVVQEGEERTVSAVAPRVGAQASDRRILLRLDGVKAFADTTYQLKTFVHPRSADFSAMSEEEKKRYLVRVVTVWRMHKGRHDDEHGQSRVYVDLTEAIADMESADWTVTVKAESMPLVAPGSSSYRENKAIEDTRLEPLIEIIGAMVLEER